MTHSQLSHFFEAGGLHASEELGVGEGCERRRGGTVGIRERSGQALERAEAR